MSAKKALAEEIVAKYHGAAEAKTARERFEATVQRGEIPADVPEVAADPQWRRIGDVIVGCGFAASKREAERLVAGHACKLDGVTVTDPRQPWPIGAAPIVITVGNRRFARILPKGTQ